MRLYDSKSGEVRELVPLQPGKLGIYVCGMTVYDHCHIGHARTFLVFDALVRHLRAQGLQVRYVRNITDVDDRIIDKAGELGVQGSELAESMIASMDSDFARLGMVPPDVEPRATVAIVEIQKLIAHLMDAGLAYRTGDGDVWFRVRAFDNYGVLSGRSGDDAAAAYSRQAGDSAGQKEDLRDFALWKASNDADRAVGSLWDSPWGPGRPGWHIECSAMSMRDLGAEFDLHGGGLDLLFPHHENELAQSEGAGCAFARHWMHVAPLRMGTEKMSKSLGNCLGIAEALERWRPDTIRHALLNAHYRTHIDFSDERMDASRAVLDRWYGAIESAGVAPAAADSSQRADFVAAMEDDLNIPAALAALASLARAIHKGSGKAASTAALAGELVALASPLGLLQQASDAWFRSADTVRDGLSDSDIEARIGERQRAREEGDYERADRLREQLSDAGVELLDSAEGTSWRRL